MLVRIDGHQTLEKGTALGCLGIEPIDGLYTQQTMVLLALLGRPYLAAHEVAGPQAEAPDLREAHIDIVRTRQKAILAQEAKTFLHEIQHSLAEEVALQLSL